MKHIILLIAFTFFKSLIIFSQTDDLSVIKKRVIEDLFREKTEDSRVEVLLSKMKPDGSFDDINYADLSRTASFPQGRHTNNLAYIAKAYSIPTSSFYKSQRLRDCIILGLKYWVENDYVGDNWHDNQITTPTNLMNLMLAIGNELPAELVHKAQPMIGRANMSASGARPSGDRIVIAGILAKNFLFLGDHEEFSKIVKIIEDEMKFSTGERGVQHDFSFHHRIDRVNNTDSYGYGKFANTFGEWSYYVSGTKFQFSKEKINLLVDYYLDGIFKQLVYGAFEDVGVKNRDITIKRDAFRPKGTLEIERLFVSTDYRRKGLEDIIKLRKGQPITPSSFAKFFWQTEHFVFQRPSFYTSVRMFSTRNQNMEQPYNGPGKPTHHRGDGTNYLLLKGDEYFNIWPVYDWQKISGTTITQKPVLPSPDEIQKPGLTNFVGAVTDGLYGAVAFDFKSPHDFLEAKKSWFFFDDEYVCLGAGINPSKQLPVVTTINQALLRSAVSVLQNGQKVTLGKGSRTLENIKWVFHDNVGYLFPSPTTVTVSNQNETGRWSDITDQKNISKELVNTDVFKLYFDHGNKINNRDIHGKRLVDTFPSYQYIVVPAISEHQLNESSATNRGILVLSNTSDLQGVLHTKLGIAQLAFYRSGEIEISPRKKIKLYSQGMIQLKIKNDRINEITVADPSRTLNSISLRISGIYNVKGIKCWSDTKTNSSLFIIDLPQQEYLGKSVTLKL